MGIILGILLVYLEHIFGNYWVYMGIYWAYLGNIYDISGTKIDLILGIFWEYLDHILSTEN